MADKPLLTRGNHKLSSNTLIFNLPAIPEVCGRICPGCYAIKAQRVYPAVLPSRMQKLAASRLDTFSTAILKELANAKKPFKYVRIHESGEFTTQSYLDAWHKIATKWPSATFYAYTKKLKILDFSEIRKLPNVVVIDSLQSGGLNYGSLEHCPPGMPICEYGAAVQCGEDCTYCMTKEAQERGIWFIKH